MWEHLFKRKRDRKEEEEEEEEEEERKMSIDREASSDKGCKGYMELDVLKWDYGRKLHSFLGFSRRNYAR